MPFNPSLKPLYPEQNIAKQMLFMLFKNTALLSISVNRLKCSPYSLKPLYLLA